MFVIFVYMSHPQRPLHTSPSLDQSMIGVYWLTGICNIVLSPSCNLSSVQDLTCHTWHCHIFTHMTSLTSTMIVVIFSSTWCTIPSNLMHPRSNNGDSQQLKRSGRWPMRPSSISTEIMLGMKSSSWHRANVTLSSGWCVIACHPDKWSPTDVTGHVIIVTILHHATDKFAN